MRAELLKIIADGVVASVKGHVALAIGPVIVRLAAIEAKLAEGLPKGEKGDAGEHGAKGDPGEPGKDGAPGVDGKDGAAGRDGVDGKDGAHGEPGKDGAAGLDGKDGAPGADGKDGAPGERGEKGIDGSAGRDGKDGAEGRDGRDGKDGAAGRDAADINPLSGIDEERSYPAGTWATHRGGLWRADAQTKGMAGWRCITNGVAEVGESLEGRILRRETILSDGTISVLEARLPFLEDKGVFVEGETYSKGDSVTWGGSIWIAQVDKATEKPGTGTQWRLAVKRGRDGKEGKPGPKGDKGDAGGKP